MALALLHPAGAPTGVAPSGSSNADAVHHVHTRPTCFSDGNDHLIRLLRCASGIANAGVAKVKANATAINFAITFLPVCPSQPVNIASASATLIWVKDVARIPITTTLQERV